MYCYEISKFKNNFDRLNSWNSYSSIAKGEVTQEEYLVTELAYLLTIYKLVDLNKIKDFNYNCFWEHEYNYESNYLKSSPNKSDFENVFCKALRMEIGTHITILDQLKIGFGWDFIVHIASEQIINETELEFNGVKIYIYPLPEEIWKDWYESEK